MPRVPPINGKADVPPAHHAVVDGVVQVFGNVRGPFSMLLHSPKLAERILPLVTFFRDESVGGGAELPRPSPSLPRCASGEAAYVWAAQVAAARRNGVSLDDDRSSSARKAPTRPRFGGRRARDRGLRPPAHPRQPRHRGGLRRAPEAPRHPVAGGARRRW